LLLLFLFLRFHNEGLKVSTNILYLHCFPFKRALFSFWCTSHLKPPHPPLGPLGRIAGTFTSYTLHLGSPVGRKFPWSHGLHIPYRVICWLLRDQSVYFVAANSVSVNQCVTLGNNELFYKGSTMCWKVGAGENITHFCPRELHSLSLA